MTKSFWIIFSFLVSCCYLGLAINLQSPKNQTICSGGAAIFNCTNNDSASIFWLINGQRLPTMGIQIVSTKFISDVAVSTLVLPGTPTFFGASIVCYYPVLNPQFYSQPAFLTILGNFSQPCISFSLVNSTTTKIRWEFPLDGISALYYFIEIRNKDDVKIFEESLDDTQLVYSIPDPCEQYDAIVTAMYRYKNNTCLKNISVPIVGAQPTTPVVSFLECSLTTQTTFNVMIFVYPQPGVCSYQILWSSNPLKSSSETVFPNQSNITLTFSPNEVITITTVAFNSYGNSSNTSMLSTQEIFDVTVNTSLPGPWMVNCIFSSCSPAIGCLVVLNNSYCKTMTRNASSSSSISCPVSYKDSLPSPGLYFIEAYTILRNGSKSLYPVYTGKKELKNEGDALPTAMTLNAGGIAGIVVGIVLCIIISIMVIVLFIHFTNKKCHVLQFVYTFLPTSATTFKLHDINNEPMEPNPTSQQPDISEKSDGGNNADQTSATTGTIKQPHTSGNVHGESDSGNNADQTSTTGAIKQPHTSGNEHGEDCISPLYVACQNGHHEVIQTSLGAGADVNKAGKLRDINEAGQALSVMEPTSQLPDTYEKNLKSGLWLACAEGNIELVKNLIEAKAIVNQPNEGNVMPLYVACQNGHHEVVQTLLRAGADVNKATNCNATPLLIASGEGHHEIVKSLLAAHSDVNKATIDSATPLIMACQNGHHDVVQTLLGAGADVNKAGIDNVTPLYVACQSGHRDVVQTLLGAGADINKATKWNATPLSLASEKGYHEIVQTLLEAVADVNKATDDNVTQLYTACQKGHHDVVQTLLGKGADVDKAREGNKTPLHLACEEGHHEVVQTLLGTGADVNKVTKSTH